jgi:hypothetical protein
LVVGNHNVTVSGRSGEAVTEAELSQLSELFRELRARVPAGGDEGCGTALAKLAELEEAITSQEPDLATMEHVQGWFGRKMPALAGAVGRLVVSPIVTRIVTTAGDDLAAEFHRRFFS